MGREVFFLKDSGINDWLVSGFAKRDFPVRFIAMKTWRNNSSHSRLRRIRNLHYQYLTHAYKSIKMSKSGDVIICFLDVMGLYVFMLSVILFKRREIVVVNIMFNEGNDLITITKRILYGWMLKSKHVHPTVTSAELSLAYGKLFRLPQKRFHLLHDCYGDLKKSQILPDEVEEYIFCGGSNGRDWETIKKVAALLPHLNFVVVGPKESLLGDGLPDNLTYYHNIPYVQFEKLIRRCSFLALPLNTEAPAGLIVLFTAGLMSKAVITTDNYTMREYITSGEDGILIKMGDSENFAREANALHFNKAKRIEFGQRLCKKVEELGSPLAFTDTLIAITRQITRTR